MCIHAPNNQNIFTKNEKKILSFDLITIINQVQLVGNNISKI